MARHAGRPGRLSARRADKLKDVLARTVLLDLLSSDHARRAIDRATGNAIWFSFSSFFSIE
jgi:hypothetical protein